MKNTPNTGMIVLNVGQGDGARRGGHNGPCCRPHVVICPGSGEKDFPFPDAETLTVRALARYKKKLRTARNEAGKADAEKNKGTQNPFDQADDELRHEPVIGVKFERIFSPGLENGLGGGVQLGQLGKIPQPVKLIPQTQQSKDDMIDGTLFVAAGGLVGLLEDGKYDAIAAERFDEYDDKVAFARRTWPQRYQAAISSISDQLGQLRRVYVTSLPLTMDGLRAQNPGVSEGSLLEAAKHLLDEELQQIISIIKIYTDPFGQSRSGKYKELEAVVFAVEQAYALFEGCDPANPLTSAEAKKRLETRVFGVGNVFLARFSDQGPATIPGTRGPIGAHALEVPHNERNIIPIMLTLYMHEFRHDIFHDVDGLGEELTQVVATAIADAHDKGELVLTRETTNLGKQKVPTLQLIIKAFADMIGEVDADTSGGVLLSGPAFSYNTLSTFSAFNSQRKGIFNQRKLLRTGSGYELAKLENGQVALSFLPHPPDYIRAFIIAAALDEIGFPAEAQQCRKIADQAVGKRNIPEFITWDDVNASKGKGGPQVRIAVEDLKRVAPIVVKALIRTPLESLGGVSTTEIINWTAKSQAKTDILTDMLMNGVWPLPTDKGDIHVTHVIAASTMAYWGLCKSGMHPRDAAELVVPGGLNMILQVRQRIEKLHAETLAAEAAEAAAHRQVVGPDAGGGGAGETGEGEEEESEEAGDEGGAIGEPPAEPVPPPTSPEDANSRP
ncbi:MAG: hypothetical protein KGS72_14860 [Cyanobacteria bacterium REEB67]|nr:hypothetical protein [Cyanobacteria bacterium REEB67]